MQDQVHIIINGKKHIVPHQFAFLPISNFLREEISLTGTKIVCSEGDCGACTLMLRMPHQEKFQPINSCIATSASLDGGEIITVEGLNNSHHQLNAIQESFVKHHGAQCGFCTPGFICSLTHLYNKKETKTVQQIKNATTGNLCRCTGYQPIIDSALNSDFKKIIPLEELYTNKKIQREKTLKIATSKQTFYAPTSMKEALKLKKENTNIKIVSGLTDLGVIYNKSESPLYPLMSLHHISEHFNIYSDSKDIHIHAGVNFHQIEKFLLPYYPEFSKLIHIFASPQIKNRATLVGNIANASPIADSIPFLMATNSIITLESSHSSKEVDINDFYLGYKKMDLKSDEIITKVKIPIPSKEEKLKLYKVSVRKDMDISAVTSAIHYKLDKSKSFSFIQIVYGGVGPVVQRVKPVEDFLLGKKLNTSNLHQARLLLENDISPISDIRGSSDFRKIICKNLLDKFYHQLLEGKEI